MGALILRGLNALPARIFWGLRVSILQQLGVFGQDRMENVFPFYSGPMLSCPEAKGCRQKDSKLGVFVSTEMGILGSDGDNFSIL